MFLNRIHFFRCMSVEIFDHLGFYFTSSSFFLVSFNDKSFNFDDSVLVDEKQTNLNLEMKQVLEMCQNDVISFSAH